MRLQLLMALFLLLIQFSCESCRALEAVDDAGVDAKFLLLAIRSKDVAGLSQIDQVLREIKIDREYCRANLQAQQLPIRCFKLIRAEVEQLLLTEAQADRERQWLSALCIRRAGAIKSIKAIENRRDGVTNFEDLPESCRAAVNSRLSDMRYAAGESSPAQLFDRRFSIGPNLEVRPKGPDDSESIRSPPALRRRR
jgi:hypothetical protein